jgi:hypothetical protein
LNIAVAVLKVIGPNLRAEGVGSIALNQTKLTSTINASDILPPLPALSADMSALHFAPYPASVEDVAHGSQGTIIALGDRLRFKTRRAPTTLRVQVQNLTNAYFWNSSFSAPLFTQFQPRALAAYLTTDF